MLIAIEMVGCFFFIRINFVDFLREEGRRLEGFESQVMRRLYRLLYGVKYFRI